MAEDIPSTDIITLTRHVYHLTRSNESAYTHSAPGQTYPWRAVPIGPFSYGWPHSPPQCYSNNFQVHRNKRKKSKVDKLVSLIPVIVFHLIPYLSSDYDLIYTPNTNPILIGSVLRGRQTFRVKSRRSLMFSRTISWSTPYEHLERQLYLSQKNSTMRLSSKNVLGADIVSFSIHSTVVQTSTLVWTLGRYLVSIDVWVSLRLGLGDMSPF